MRSIKLAILFISRSLGLFRLARWITRDRLKILCYHGFSFSDECRFRSKLFISPAIFEQRLATIRRYGLNVLTLNEAVDRMYDRTLPKNALVITIDDGFHSVHTLAVPRLIRYNYPVTLYLTTYYVKNPNPVFRLVVQYMFWKSSKRELVLENVTWSANCVVNLSDARQTERTIEACITYGERECTEPMRVALCEELGVLLGTPYKDIVQSKILHLMTPMELQSLAKSNIDVELHTHRHTFSDDDQAAAQREIADNRAAIGQWLSKETHHFCYPSGLWNERQWAWLDQMNVKSSTTCLPGLNSHRTPRHALRRFLDGENIHQLEFEAGLSGFSDLLRQ
ncbi:MAG TPA: polysaccharide deacetylase family protein [Steroidobacteraceae bacterium]|nr:polysaccharide deacetylase family protein [Steroidobacteraceae bacterium]